jgi:16S rRNA G966 N2-methylase RsmD
VTDLVIPAPDDGLSFDAVERLSAHLIAWTATAPKDALLDRLDQVLALERYLAKRDMDGPMQTAARHMEAQIGRLVGPPRDGAGRPTNGEIAARGNLHHQRHVEFWKIQEYWSTVEGKLPCSRAQAIYACDEQIHRADGREVVSSRTHRGDFRDVLAYIPDRSVALVLTDPPYDAESVDLYGDLGAFAARVLVPGGSLIAYAGHAHLPDVFDALRTHLRYWWTLCLDHQHGTSRMIARHVYVGWKPVLWFVNGSRRDQMMVADTITGTRPDKARHEWAQGDECAHLVEALTLPGETVIDPFAGSGTIGETVVRLGRDYIGAEKC